jgi:hypothetical protein
MNITRREAVRKVLVAASVIATVVTSQALFAQGPAPAPAASPARWVVYGIDVSGSYHLIDKAFQQAADQVATRAGSGNVWYFRVINARSYDDSAAILTLRCPPTALRTTNPFERAGRQRERDAAVKLDQARRAAADYLRRFRPKRADRTDVFGFLAKAGELLESAPDGTEKVLFVSSDLADNVGQRGAIKLAGVRVVIAVFQGGADAQATQNLRARWTERFLRWGARDVTFVDPSQAVVAELLGR